MKKIILLMALLMLPIAFAAQVERDLPATASSGQQVTVTLTATGNSGDYFVIVRDKIPTGWTYVSGGALEGDEVKGFISSLAGNSMTYTLQAGGSATFTGTYQYSDDASPLPIVGDNTVTINGVNPPPPEEESDYTMLYIIGGGILALFAFLKLAK